MTYPSWVNALYCCCGSFVFTAHRSYVLHLSQCWRRGAFRMPVPLCGPWVASFAIGLAMVMTFEDVGSLITEITESPLVSACFILHATTMFTTVLLVLTWLSLRLNPWVTILITWFAGWGVGILYIITFFIAFGFMSGPGPLEQQVLFHVGWITAGLVLAYLLIRSIRSTLQGEASVI